MKSYHNSNNETGTTLKRSNDKALTQDESVINYFLRYDNLGATPERVLRHFKIMEKLSERRWHNTPIVSIRRSFSNLKRKGLIRKTDVKITGDYGKMIHIWRLN